MDIVDWIRILESAGQPDPGPLPPDPTLLSGERGEQVLWRACAGERLDPASVSARGTGPLLAPDAYLAIEVWAECELAALHALHRLARGSGAAGGPLRRRVRQAAEWHLEHTQPDNSTNRPWSLHVFILLGDASGEGALYAETLLHNMTATDARKEPLSRWIVADAARELRMAAASRVQP